MTVTREDLSLSRLELVVLARLSPKPPTLSELTKCIHALALSGSSAADARRRVEDALNGLRERGFVSNKKKRRSVDRTVTEAGVRALRAAFGVNRTPTWREARSTHLLALASASSLDADRAQAANRDGEAINAAVLTAEFSLPTATSVTALCDALIAEALGMQRGTGRLTLSGIRAYCLARRLGVDAKGTPEEIAARVAASKLNARAGQKKFMLPALVRRWIQGDPRVEPRIPVPNPEPREPTHTLTDQNIIMAVREAVPRVGPDGRYGSEKVFVAAIWRNLEHDRRLADLSLDRFKRWLVTANRHRWLSLIRADLLGAMDPKLVAESEIEDRGATFHFVIDEWTDALGMERGAHAR